MDGSHGGRCKKDVTVFVTLQTGHTWSSDQMLLEILTRCDDTPKIWQCLCMIINK